ncbi:ribose-phosphate diphosphokinase [Patescibacteria group bacterium]|nr:ribose-phosphate diphosphokinase [Patescibacteria group bacterium]MBU4481782.1 ribose-phosphate diphosphokinase [Patescibacteria group bacterium]
MKTYLIPTSAAEHFAKKIKNKELKIILPDLNRENKRYFPDGEIYVRLSKVKEMKEKRVIVLHSGAPKPNEGLVELELLLQILKDNDIKPELFFTYFPYGRQDKIFEQGETNVAENLIHKLVNHYKVKRIYIVEPHFTERDWIKNYPLVNVSATPILMAKARQDFGKNILFLATDKGGQRRFKVEGFNKVRENSYRVELRLSEKIINSIKGKTVGLIDDLIGTGGTLLKAGELVKKYGAKKVVCLLTHALLEEGIEKIRKNFAQVYLTNTIEQPKIPQIDITELILNAIINL